MFGPTFGLKNPNNFNLRSKITQKKSLILCTSIFLQKKKIGATLYFSQSGAKSLKCLVMGASTLDSHMGASQIGILYLITRRGYQSSVDKFCTAPQQIFLHRHIYTSAFPASHLQYIMVPCWR